MKFVAALLVALIATAARAERILLIPLDSRPATGQFAQMVAKIAGVDVVMPPYEDLGRFTDPGRPDAILAWLESQDMRDVSAVICSSDMVAYGGLIASRTGATPVSVAIQRMQRLAAVVRRAPHVRLYVFSATMRLLPTAVTHTVTFRNMLASYEEAKAKFDITGSKTARDYMLRLRAKVPKAQIQTYEATRLRDHLVQEKLLRMQAAGNFDYLVIGQDDARPFGPHVPETLQLRRLAANLNEGNQVFFCEGVDQHACVLVSRALLEEAQWQPRVRIEYSDDDGKYLYASFESIPIKDSLRDQILASGARLVGPSEEYDYSLYVNTPGRNEHRFQQFILDMASDLDQGFPTAVADIDLSHNGTADPELFQSLWENRRLMRLISYAGWNTAGNTMGTAIPASNVYLLARRSNTVDPLARETAAHEFLLHRLVNDYGYHRFTRPQAYKMIQQDRRGTTDELYGAEFEKVNAFVQKDLRSRLLTYFDSQFLDRKFYAGTQQYQFSGIDGIKIWLPWPRPYEVRLEFHVQTEPVVVGQTRSTTSSGAEPRQ